MAKNNKKIEKNDEFDMKFEMDEFNENDNNFGEFDSINVSDEDGFSESDSDLDIGELLRKYMPEYEDETV